MIKRYASTSPTKESPSTIWRILQKAVSRNSKLLQLWMKIRKPKINNPSSNHLLMRLLRQHYLPTKVKTKKVFLNPQIFLKVRRSHQARKHLTWYASQLKITQHTSHKLGPSISMTRVCQQVRISPNLNFRRRRLKNLRKELVETRMEMCCLLKMMKPLAHRPTNKRNNWKLKISTIKELTQLPRQPPLEILDTISKNIVDNSKTRIR